MVRRHPTASTAGSPQLSAGRGRKQKRSAITLDEFTSAVYLPHIAMRKRSWRLDERILRQHISPVFGARKLAAIERQDVELGLDFWSKADGQSAYRQFVQYLTEQSSPNTE